MNLEDSADREQALTVRCPDCDADRSEPCVRPDGRELTRAPAHIARLRAAGVMHAPIDSRELRRA